ncbi:MAG: tryptophan synthase subunit alpha [Phycisphaerae bacterium]|nr:tryptophan synthase subunit alpha [Phycisphaerae bacterium]
MTTPRGDGSRIDQAMRSQAPGLWPFVVGGYPTPAGTTGLLAALASAPIRGIEIGIPFSDPIADGPVIQSAFAESLANGTRVADVLSAISAARRSVEVPIIAMVSASIVYRLGVRAFVERAAASGVDGLIVPDISLEEASGLAAATGDAGLRLPMLVAPTTPDERRERIAGIASGFLYYVSVQGTTGARMELPADLEANIRRVRDACAMPVMVGFGISQREHVRRVCAYADGAIVGSAIVREMQTSYRAGAGDDAAVESVVSFVRGLCDD